MDIGVRHKFTGLWSSDFEGSDLPITFWIGKDTATVKKAPAPKVLEMPARDRNRT